MKKANTVQEIARVFHDTLINVAQQQLREAARHVAEIGTDDPDLATKLEAALPPEVLPQVRRLLLLLIQDNRIGELTAIAHALEQYSQSISSTLKSEVTSAIPLDAQQQEHIREELQKRYGQHLEVSFHVDPSVIGGLVIRVGDHVFDNSLRSRLGRIQHSMLTS